MMLEVYHEEARNRNPLAPFDPNAPFAPFALVGPDNPLDPDEPEIFIGERHQKRQNLLH